MNKGIGIILLFILLPLTLFGLASAYDNSKYHFSVTAPSGWIATEGSNDVMTGVTFRIPENQTSADVNFYVIHEKMNGLTINDFIANSSAIFSYIGKSESSYTLVSNVSRTVNGLIGYELIYTVPYKGADLKFDEIIFVENDLMYGISCRALSFNFDKMVPKFEESISNFKIDETSASVSPNIPELPFVATVSILFIVLIGTITVKKRFNPNLFTKTRVGCEQPQG
jgi:hypothetical protein